MTTADIVTIKITDKMVAEAEEDERNFKQTGGRNTRADSEKRDITGSIAHQAVEMLFTQMD